MAATLTITRRPVRLLFVLVAATMSRLLGHPQLFDETVRCLLIQELVVLREVSSALTGGVDAYIEEEVTEYILQGNAYVLPKRYTIEFSRAAAIMHPIVVAFRALGLSSGQRFKERAIPVLHASTDKSQTESIPEKERKKAAEVWTNLGNTLRKDFDGERFAVEDKQFKKTELYIQALAWWPLPRAYYNLGCCMPSPMNVNGTTLSVNECMRHALELDHTEAVYWMANGRAGGMAEFDGRKYTAAECYARAVELAPLNHTCWLNLAIVRETLPEVSGKRYTNEECIVKALELSPKAFRGWWFAAEMLGREKKHEIHLFKQQVDAITCWATAYCLMDDCDATLRSHITSKVKAQIIKSKCDVVTSFFKHRVRYDDETEAVISLD